LLEARCLEPAPTGRMRRFLKEHPRSDHFVPPLFTFICAQGHSARGRERERASERASERGRDTQRDRDRERERERESWHKTEARVSGPCLFSLRSLPLLFGTAGLRWTSSVETSRRESKPQHSPSTSLWPKLNLKLNQKEKEQHRRQGPPLTLHKPSSIVDFVSQVAGTPI
jgi:hypothetical protein